MEALKTKWQSSASFEGFSKCRASLKDPFRWAETHQRDFDGGVCAHALLYSGLKSQLTLQVIIVTYTVK